MSDVLGRREFLAAGVGLAVGAVGLAGCQSGMSGGISSKGAYRNGFAAEPLDVVRVGVIGVDHGKHYFHDSWKPLAMHDDNLAEARHHWGELYEMAKEVAGVEVFNLSKHTDLTWL